MSLKSARCLACYYIHKREGVKTIIQIFTPTKYNSVNILLNELLTIRQGQSQKQLPLSKKNVGAPDGGWDGSSTKIGTRIAKMLKRLGVGGSNYPPLQYTVTIFLEQGRIFHRSRREIYIKNICKSLSVKCMFWQLRYKIKLQKIKIYIQTKATFEKSHTKFLFFM